MSIRTLATFAVAIFFGLIAVLMVRSYLGAGRQGPGAGLTAGTTPVVVAAAPIQRGVKVQPGMLKVVSYPRDSVPAGAFQSVGQVAGVDRLALRTMGVNEPVLADRISGTGAKTNLSGSLTPGMRAVSVRSNEVIGVAGFALPGDRVDVLATRPMGSGEQTTSITQALAENVRVLGVDQSDDMDADKPVVAKAVTIEVTPDQAQAISLAQSIGAITLSLRQMTDGAALQRRTTTVADLGGPTGHRPNASGPAPAGAGHAAARTPAKPGRAATQTAEINVVRGVQVTGYSLGSH